MRNAGYVSVRMGVPCVRLTTDIRGLNIEDQANSQRFVVNPRLNGAVKYVRLHSKVCLNGFDREPPRTGLDGEELERLCGVLGPSHILVHYRAAQQGPSSDPFQSQ